MTSFSLPIQRVSIEAFRGFRDRQEFDLSASVVIISGPNGTGKTSFFDALQWCLLGSIQRLESLRARKSVEHIVNQYRLSDRASVEVEMSVDAQNLVLRRTGDHSGSTLELRMNGGEPLFGDEAERALARLLVPSEGLTLEVALTTSGLMQQDVMRAVLEAKPADRYKHISTVLGLGSLEDFEDAVRSVAKTAKATTDAARSDRDAALASLDRARERLESARHRVATSPRVELIQEEIRSRLEQAPDGLTLEGGEPLEGREDFRNLAAHAASLLQSLKSFSNLWSVSRGWAATLEDEPPNERRHQLQGEVESARQSLDAAQAALEVAEAQRQAAEAAAEDVVRLATIAIPLLADECPVCGQEIDPRHVEEELRARSSDTGTTIALRDRVESARAKRDEARASLAKLEARLASLDEVIGQWNKARASAERARHAWQSIPADGPLAVASPDEEYLAQRLPSILEYVQGLRSLVLDSLDSLERASDQGAVSRAESEVASFAEAMEARQVKLEEVSQRSQRLRLLADAAVDARVDVTERRFRAIQPLVADIFGRLDPHPAFKTIEFELDTYYRRGTTTPMVRDLVEEVTADPLMVFSTSQANIAALSYFLAMGWSAGDQKLPFVLLDDPVQSMDDVNVLGFADLCRHLRRERQLLISTHERRFASLLERKLAPRSQAESTRVLHFVAWDRSGPAVEVRVIEPQLIEEPIRVVQAAV